MSTSALRPATAWWRHTSASGGARTHGPLPPRTLRSTTCTPDPRHLRASGSPPVLMSDYSVPAGLELLGFPRHLRRWRVAGRSARDRRDPRRVDHNTRPSRKQARRRRALGFIARLAALVAVTPGARPRVRVGQVQGARGRPEIRPSVARA